MAFEITSKLFRVSIDSERNFIFVCAENTEELIHYLGSEYAGKREIYGAKEIQKDGSLRTATVVTDPLFKQLFGEDKSEMNNKKPDVDYLIAKASEQRDRMEPMQKVVQEKEMI